MQAPITSWKKLHTGTNADTGRIAAATLTNCDADDASQVGPLLDRMSGPVTSFTANDERGQDAIYGKVAARCPDAGQISLFLM